MDKKKEKKLAPPPVNYESMREGVLIDELRARHWKAQYETAYYHLKFKEIEPEYQAQLQKDKEAYQEQLARFQEEIAKMQAEEKEKAEKEDSPVLYPS